VRWHVKSVAQKRINAKKRTNLVIDSKRKTTFKLDLSYTSIDHILNGAMFSLNSKYISIINAPKIPTTDVLLTMEKLKDNVPKV
jgi:hypothetical protein